MEQTARQRVETIRLPKDLKEEIQQRADYEGQSFNSEIITLLRKALKEE